jgi:hypothetical protein
MDTSLVLRMHMMSHYYTHAYFKKKGIYPVPQAVELFRDCLSPMLRDFGVRNRYWCAKWA